MCKQEQEIITDETMPLETFTIKEIGEILKIGTNSTYNLIHSKAFPVIKIGRSYRVPKEPFYTWLNESHTVPF
jgi:excisionase family DNA binding protein